MPSTIAFVILVVLFGTAQIVVCGEAALSEKGSHGLSAAEIRTRSRREVHGVLHESGHEPTLIQSHRPLSHFLDEESTLFREGGLINEPKIHLGIKGKVNKNIKYILNISEVILGSISLRSSIPNILRRHIYFGKFFSLCLII